MAKSLAHTKYMCKYHIVFIPKYKLRKETQKYIIDLCKWKGVEIIEVHMMPDQVHLLVEVPPRISVSSFMGYLKGKSSLKILKRIRI